MKYRFTSFILIPILFLTCFTKDDLITKVSSGKALGTFYRIKYIVPKKSKTVDYTKAFDSVFNSLNNSLSTYDKNSIISRVNENDTSVILDDLFKYVFRTSKSVFRTTKGFFDPSIGTITTRINKKNNKIDSIKMSKLIKLVNMNNIKMVNGKIIKSNKKIALDFNAIAKGYALDLLANIFDNNDINNYLIEIGGEIKAKGKNINNKDWLIGIENPERNKPNRHIYMKIVLNNKSMATSGTYRNYFYKNNQELSHIITPLNIKIKNKILSASVIADSCILADAYATSLVAMGLDKAKEFVDSFKEIEALIIYKDQNDKLNYFATDYFNKFINDF